MASRLLEVAAKLTFTEPDRMLRRIPATPRPATMALLLLMSACGLRTPLPAIDTSQDARIRSEVQARIAAEPGLDAADIRVEVLGRMVTLHGSVRGIAAWQCAIANAELVDDVESVSDYLVIVRGEREITCLAPRPEAGTIVSGD